MTLKNFLKVSACCLVILIAGVWFFVEYFEQSRTAVAGTSGPLSYGANAAVTTSAGNNNGFETTFGAAVPITATTSNDSGLFSLNSGSNTSTACSLPNTVSDQHNFSTFNLVVPSNATVNGISVTVEGKYDSNTGTNTFCIFLSHDGGTTWTAGKNTADIGTADITTVLGSATDTWGRTWTPTELNNTNFRVRVMTLIANTARDASLDYIGVTVAYNQPPATPTISAPANNATSVLITPTFTMNATDGDSNNLGYKVTLYSNNICSAVVQTIEQSVSSTGWTGTNTTCTNSPTGCYTSGTSGSYTLPVSSALSYATQYWWKASAKDPDGTNTYTDSSCNTFTTQSAPTFTQSAYRFFAGGTPGSSTWYDTSYEYRRKFTIDNTKVTGGNLTNFPVLVSTTATYLKSTTHGGNLINGDGNALLFTASDGVTKLSHEVESYSSTTGALVAWVKVPTVADATDTDIYLYYGSATTTNQQNAAGVWDSNYLGVYHLNESSGTTLADSTTNLDHATKFSATEPNLATSSKIGNAQNFDGVNDYAYASGIALPTGDFTYEAWVNMRALSDEIVLGAGNGSSANEFYLYIRTTGSVLLNIHDGDIASTDSNIISGNAWWYLVGYRTGSTVNIYLNGVADPSSGTDATAFTFNGCGLLFGTEPDSACNGTLGNWFNGMMDEVRVSNIGRSAGWVATSYNTMNSPSTFFSNLGTTEETVPNPTGLAMAAQDTAATALTSGTPFRLRQLIHVGNGLGTGLQSFKLQYSPMSGTCDATYTGESYVDVATTTGAIRFYDAAGISTGSLMTASTSDPVHSGHTSIVQTYVEENSFTNSKGAIANGQDGIWDFSLVTMSPSGGSSYCFRIVKADGNTLDTYSVFPELTIPGGSSMTFSVGAGTESLPVLTPGTLSATSSILEVITTNASGFTISAERSLATGTLQHTDLTTYIPDKTAWIAPGATTTVGNSTASSTQPLTLQFRVRQTGTDVPNYASTWWGINDTTTSALFAGFPTTSQTIINRSTAALASTTARILYNVNVPATQKSGNYTGTITFTSVANP